MLAIETKRGIKSVIVGHPVTGQRKEKIRKHVLRPEGHHPQQTIPLAP